MHFLLFLKLVHANLTGKVLVFDNAASLLTSIQLQETIGIANCVVLNNNPNLRLLKKKLFLFAISQTHFLTRNYYNQIDDVAMCSHLAPRY